MIETILWLFVAIFFMVATFCFGVIVYFTFQLIRLWKIEQEIKDFEKILKEHKRVLNKIINETKKVKIG